ncbi:hypothetical protein H6F51_05270 [Cyanobacteria bacterium FACHB-DQ100]|nr:hypothetical protein [Cyanobacteria bacterium FACHB-DQ100]
MRTMQVVADTSGYGMKADSSVWTKMNAVSLGRKPLSQHEWTSGSAA